MRLIIIIRRVTIPTIKRALPTIYRQLQDNRNVTEDIPFLVNIMATQLTDNAPIIELLVNCLLPFIEFLLQSFHILGFENLLCIFHTLRVISDIFIIRLHNLFYIKSNDQVIIKNADVRPSAALLDPIDPRNVPGLGIYHNFIPGS